MLCQGLRPERAERLRDARVFRQPVDGGCLHRPDRTDIPGRRGHDGLAYGEPFGLAPKPHDPATEERSRYETSCAGGWRRRGHPGEVSVSDLHLDFVWRGSLAPGEG